MYCEINDIVNLLPPSIGIGDENLGTPSPGRPDTKRSKLTPAETISFIRLAQQEIDGRLRNVYACPLRRIKQYETYFNNDLTAAANVIVNVEDALDFSVGCIVRIQDSSIMEMTTVTSITDSQNLVVAPLTNSYDSSTGKISIIAFPDPIPLTTARLTVAIAYDVLVIAEQAPDVSQYGKEQRRLAGNSIDSILSGTVLLVGQEITNRRFIRGTILDAMDTPIKDFQFGREKA